MKIKLVALVLAATIFLIGWKFCGDVQDATGIAAVFMAYAGLLYAVMLRAYENSAT